MPFLYGSLSSSLPSFPAPPASTQRPSVIGARKPSESVTMLSRQPVGMESSVFTHNVTGTSGVSSMGSSVLSGGSFPQSRCVWSVCVCMRACVHTCVCACVRVCIHVCVHTCVCAYMCVCIRACACVCICVCMSSKLTSKMWLCK